VPQDGIEKKFLIEMQVKRIGLIRGRKYIEQLVKEGRLAEFRAKGSRGPGRVFVTRIKAT
jgi:hypothetical protein